MSELHSPTSHCARHSDRAAVELCARCGDLVCDLCWSASYGLCDSCAQRNPLYHVEKLPWEQTGLPVFQRIQGTLMALLRPWTRAAAFGHGTVSDAARFALWVTVPMSCLAGIIPLTRTLLFQSPLSISLIGKPSVLDIAWDILRALLLGPVITFAMLLPVLGALLLGALFRKPRIWVRDVLYWSWLPPLLIFLVHVPGFISAQLAFLGFVPFPLAVLCWVAQGYVARRAVLLSWPLTVLVLWLVGTASILGFFAGFWYLTTFASGVSPGLS